MSKTRTISAIILIAISVLGGPAEAATTPDSTGGITGPAHITLLNKTDNRQPLEVVTWAVNRYSVAGLVLPDSEITFHPFDPSLENCNGHGGYHTVSEGEHIIDVCAVGVPSRRRLVLHEFAHAWARENLTDSQREALMADRELETWNDHDVEWAQRGTEHAAEIITWGLDMQCSPHEIISDQEAASLAAAFEFLTGTETLCEA